MRVPHPGLFNPQPSNSYTFGFGQSCTRFRNERDGFAGGGQEKASFLRPPAAFPTRVDPRFEPAHEHLALHFAVTLGMDGIEQIGYGVCARQPRERRRRERRQTPTQNKREGEEYLALHKGSLFNTTSYGYGKDYIQWATKNCFVVGSKVGAMPTSRRSAVVICKVAGRNMIVQIRIMPSCTPW